MLDIARVLGRRGPSPCPGAWCQRDHRRCARAPPRLRRPGYRARLHRGRAAAARRCSSVTCRRPSTGSGRRSSVASGILSTASCMLPRRNGLCGGCSPARKPPLEPGRGSRGGTRTAAVVSLTPSSCARRRASSTEDSRNVHRPSCIVERGYGRRRTAHGPGSTIRCALGAAAADRLNDDLDPEEDETDRGPDDEDGERREERHLLERVLRSPKSRSARSRSRRRPSEGSKRRFTAPRVPLERDR